jgi:hypothetical protein
MAPPGLSALLAMAVTRRRQPVNRETPKLIRQTCLANPLWGAPRIHDELLKLGIKVSQATVVKYMLRRPHSPSSTWRNFLHNHALRRCRHRLFIVPSATFRLLFVMLILAHDRRKIVRFDAAVESHLERGAIDVRYDVSVQDFVLLFRTKGQVVCHGRILPSRRWPMRPSR